VGREQFILLQLFLDATLDFRRPRRQHLRAVRRRHRQQRAELVDRRSQHARLRQERGVKPANQPRRDPETFSAGRTHGCIRSRISWSYAGGGVNWRMASRSSRPATDATAETVAALRLSSARWRFWWP